ncbi:MAG: hypothetical protein R2832_04115 [Rhodothermales bacterium]
MDSAKKYGTGQPAEKQSKSDVNGHAGEIAGGAELEKIRSILFGDAYRELAERHESLRRTLESSVAKLEKSLVDRLEREVDSLRSDDERNLKVLSDRISSEGGTLTASIEALGDKLAESDDRHSSSVKELALQSADEMTKHKSAFESGLRSLEDETAKQAATLSSRIDSAIEHLRESKSDRLQLADLFDTLARALRSNGNADG